jgi:deoxyribodipyrimidine photo-lyase
MSSPVTAYDACSRLSAPFAYGCLSMREAAQAAKAAQQAVRAAPGSGGGWGAALNAFVGRLHWHCHFIQKLEDRPESEWRNVHSGYDGMREDAFDRALFEAWRDGRTGLPFVDACMRALAATGWINFRMRAMLTAVASYHLWLHWREPGEHLARLFTDYEPGIHWSQMQMQSGTTGINTVRIYNPVKQGFDHDPDGRFVRTWVPELARVPTRHVHTPWTMDRAEQAAAGCVVGRDYPEPVVDHQAAAKRAREGIWAVRRSPEFRAEADAIQQRHGSRKSGLPPSTPTRRRRRDDRQLGLEI